MGGGGVRGCPALVVVVVKGGGGVEGRVQVGGEGLMRSTIVWGWNTRACIHLFRLSHADGRKRGGGVF